MQSALALRNARLEPHVDRTATHVVSSMLFVADDSRSPWPLHLEVDGTSHRVVPQAGQMVLYEGASVPHGHLEPLDGEAVVVALLHYRPVNWQIPDDDDPIRQARRDGLIDARGELRAEGSADG